MNVKWKLLDDDPSAGSHIRSGMGDDSFPLTEYRASAGFHRMPNREGLPGPQVQQDRQLTVTGQTIDLAWIMN